MDSFYNILSTIFEVIGGVWRFRIATIDGNDLTFANVTIALLVFVIGIKLSRRISKFIVSKLLARTAIGRNAKAAIQSLAFYALIIIFLLLALDIAQIPIKIFAFMGGALAIGIGFGSQNIIKDFISGIILMIEQPVRVGDMIEINETTRGQVVRIGAISTHILTFRNVDVLVPNHSLIEGNVINWTLTSNEAKRLINVGVAYGSPTKKVAELISQAVKENEAVIKKDKVETFFVNFGDNTLDFEVHFWINMNRPGDERKISSEIRHNIVDLFHKNNIEIAFPQRDVHLDSAKPLEIKLVEGK